LRKFIYLRAEIRTEYVAVGVTGVDADGLMVLITVWGRGGTSSKGTLFITLTLIKEN